MKLYDPGDGDLQIKQSFDLWNKVTISPTFSSQDDLAGIHIRTCLPVIVRNFKFLAYEWNSTQKRIAAEALLGGIGRLWFFNGSEEIERISNFLITEGANDEDMRMFRNRSFDFGTSEHEKFTGVGRTEDVSKCRKLAEILGVTYTAIYQLAFMAGLITADIIRTEDVNRMVGILKRFRKCVEDWAQRARELEEKYKERPKQTNPDRRMTWQDVLKD